MNGPRWRKRYVSRLFEVEVGKVIQTQKLLWRLSKLIAVNGWYWGFEQRT